MRFTSAIISSSILTACGDVTKAVTANLRIRVTKIIACIKSDYFTVRHIDDEGRTGGRKGWGGVSDRGKRDISLIVSISFAFYLVYLSASSWSAGARQLLISVSPIEIRPAFLST